MRTHSEPLTPYSLPETISAWWLLLLVQVLSTLSISTLKLMGLSRITSQPRSTGLSSGGEGFESGVFFFSAVCFEARGESWAASLGHRRRPERDGGGNCHVY